MRNTLIIFALLFFLTVYSDAAVLPAGIPDDSVVRSLRILVDTEAEAREIWKELQYRAESALFSALFPCFRLNTGWICILVLQPMVLLQLRTHIDAYQDRCKGQYCFKTCHHYGFQPPGTAGMQCINKGPAICPQMVDGIDLHDRLDLFERWHFLQWQQEK